MTPDLWGRGPRWKGFDRAQALSQGVRICGQDTWDLLVRGAQAANWVILPIGRPTCLTLPGQREELPEGLDENVVMVESGTDLRAVIEVR